MAPHHNTAVRSLLTNFFRRKTVYISADWLVRFGRNATQFRPKEDTGNAFYWCFVPSSEALPQLIRLKLWENTQLMPRLRGVQLSCAKYKHTKQKVLK